MSLCARTALKSGCSFVHRAISLGYHILGRISHPSPNQGFVPWERRTSILCIRFPHVQKFEIMSRGQMLEYPGWVEMTA